jgi:two-component system response regulator RegA
MTSSSEEGRTMLLVDDDAPFRRRLARAFAERGYVVLEADTVAAALGLAREESPELAVVDLRVPDGDGLEIVRVLKRVDPNTNIVVLTGYGSIATALEAVRMGATHYLTKPADVDDLLAAFSRGDESLEQHFGKEAPRAEHPAPTLARVEWEHIQRVLADCSGNVSEAARRLGIHRRSLQRKLAKHPVPR